MDTFSEFTKNIIKVSEQISGYMNGLRCKPEFELEIIRRDENDKNNELYSYLTKKDREKFVLMFDKHNNPYWASIVKKKNTDSVEIFVHKNKITHLMNSLASSRVAEAWFYPICDKEGNVASSKIGLLHVYDEHKKLGIGTELLKLVDYLAYTAGSKNQSLFAYDVLGQNDKDILKNYYVNHGYKLQSAEYDKIAEEFFPQPKFKQNTNRQNGYKFEKNLNFQSMYNTVKNITTYSYKGNDFLIMLPDGLKPQVDKELEEHKKQISTLNIIVK